MIEHLKITIKDKSMSLLIRIITIIMFVGLYSCDYSREIKKETAKIFDSHKKFMTELSFGGVVYEKNICENCKMNKYTLKIGLTQLDKKPEFGDTHYSPYYIFENDSILTISVDVILFNGVDIKDTVTKKSKSLTINVNQIKLQYLSSEKKYWLPTSSD